MANSKAMAQTRSENGGDYSQANRHTQSIKMKLREYQNKAIDQLRTTLKQHRRALLVLPTGGGKTVIFNHIAANATGRVLILVHRVELLRQTVDKYGGDIGTIEAGKPTPSNRVIVGMVQTVVNRLRVM